MRHNGRSDCWFTNTPVRIHADRVKAAERPGDRCDRGRHENARPLNSDRSLLLRYSPFAAALRAAARKDPATGFGLTRRLVPGAIAGVAFDLGGADFPHASPGPAKSVAGGVVRGGGSGRVLPPGLLLASYRLAKSSSRLRVNGPPSPPDRAPAARSRCRTLP